jgi:hypothetical protein
MAPWPPSPIYLPGEEDMKERERKKKMDRVRFPLPIYMKLGKNLSRPL